MTISVHKVAKDSVPEKDSALHCDFGRPRRRTPSKLVAVDQLFKEAACRWRPVQKLDRAPTSVVITSSGSQ